MTLQHFFTDPALVSGDRVALQAGEAHHASSAARVRVGETISIADGTGLVYDAVVVESSKSQVVGRIVLRHQFRPREPKLILWQGLAKGERMDLAISRAVELGASAIVPFRAERSIPRWDTSKRAAAHRRWQSLALASAKVSRAPYKTEILHLADGFEDLGDGLRIVLHEGAEENLRSVLPQDPPQTVTLVVGPEGGLTDAEVARASEGGALIASLGERLLRTETAGTVALSIVSFVYGILG